MGNSEHRGTPEVSEQPLTPMGMQKLEDRVIELFGLEGALKRTFKIGLSITCARNLSSMYSGTFLDSVQLLVLLFQHMFG